MGIGGKVICKKEAVSMAIEKAGIEKWQLRMIYAGDLRRRP